MYAIRSYYVPFNGYYLNEVALPTNRFRIPPRELEETLPQQLLMLQTAADALQDASVTSDENRITSYNVCYTKLLRIG